MAGTKGKSGGARKGAGRKPKQSVTEHQEPQAHGGSLKRSKAEPVPQEPKDMLQFLQDVALGRTDASATQVRAAIAAVQYTHSKKGEGGKKEARDEAAKEAGKGKFGAAPAPLRAVK